jgi:hypothetical protein
MTISSGNVPPIQPIARGRVGERDFIFSDLRNREVFVDLELVDRIHVFKLPKQ